MILSPSEDFVYSSLGWVDHGSIWCYDTSSNFSKSVKVSDADYLSLHDADENVFSIAHNWNKGSGLTISVHQKNEQATLLSSCEIANGQANFSGDLNVWTNLSKVQVSYIEYEGITNYWLIKINPFDGTAEFHSLDWFDDSYDHGYQGVIGAIEVPGSELVIISVQRDSSPVLFDPNGDQLIKKLTLADRHGNPRLKFSNSGKFLWADDYDTLIKLDGVDWHMINSRRMQDAAGANTMQFMGSYWLNNSENECTVARPFSSDVVTVSTEDFKTLAECNLPGQPLRAVTLSDGRVVARDWKSGDTLSGTLKRKKKLFFFA